MSYAVKLAIILTTAAVLLGLTLFYFWYENNVLRIVRYDARMPAGFEGFRIVHLSDLHDHRFGKDQRRLVRRIEAERPDVIVITGDLIHNEYTGNALSLARQLPDIAPTYYVNGNHECILSFQAAFNEQLRAAGITVLEDETMTLTRNGDEIRLVGLSDPMSRRNVTGARARRAATVAALNDLLAHEQAYTLLLTHRPELFDDYQEADLVLAGHAHAGQVRLPFAGALLTPGEGLHPKYDVGAFRSGKTTMIVSGGLGSSNIVPRVNNRPQLVVVQGAAGEKTTS